jgi:hypothetical protein
MTTYSTDKLIFLTDGKRHLVCLPYSVDNLHKMADTLGLGRHWFHSGRLAHYDIPMKRMNELTENCKLISSKELVRICRGEYHEPKVSTQFERSRS